MIDVNGTRHHLLLGRDDWGVPGADASPLTSDKVVWNGARSEVTLREKTYAFRTGAGDRIPDPEDHRGAAMDRYGNWYWIDPARRAILVTSSGSRSTETFWPPPDVAPARRPAGAFAPASAAAKAPSWTLAGLVVTDHHYLVTGAHAGDGSVRLLVFDLFGGGAPLEMLWPADVSLAVRDMAPAPSGGLWILDRGRRDVSDGYRGRYWRLDRHFRVVRHGSGSTPPSGGFAPSLPSTSPERSVEPARPLSADDAFDASSEDPIAIEGLPDGSVLVLDNAQPESILRLIPHATSDDGSGAPTAELSIARFQELLWQGADDDATEGSPSEVPAFAPRALDVAFVPDKGCPWPGSGDVYLVSAQGNQALRVRLEASAQAADEAPVDVPPRFVAKTDYLPMRLHMGLGLVTAAGRAHYDSSGRWIALVAQQRPRFESEGVIVTRVFDSREPGCVWHRLDLDATLPGGTAVEVWSRASDERDERGEPRSEWESKRTAFVYRRRDGSELPFAPKGTREGEGTWEVLLQHARGRYLQLSLRLIGDGVRSPSLRALRVWYPRFSYRDRYLPAVYRDQDAGGFLDRFLANFEGTLTTIEGRIAAAQMLFDVRSCPPEALDWLASWFGVLLDPAWDDHRRRLFIGHAMQFFQMRGTVRGLRAAVALATSECVDERLFSDAGADAYGPFGVRVVEQFRAREFPAALLGDSSGRAPSETLIAVTPGDRWRPSEGLTSLRVRFGLFLDRSIRGEHPSDALRADQHVASTPESFPTRAPGFDSNALRTLLRGALELTIPLDQIELDELAWRRFIDDAWRAFVRDALGLPDLADGTDVPGWRRYLEARYRTPTALATAHGTAVTSFDAVTYPDPLTGNAALLDDWYRFESAARPTRRTAHRFTVLLPVPAGGAADEATLQQRLKVAARVVALEKPANTSFDVRFYWAMFRVGRARLAHDTLIDLGSRAPDLMPPAVAGRAYLGQAYVATTLPDDAIDRRPASGSVIRRVQGSSQETSA